MSGKDIKELSRVIGGDLGNLLRSAGRVEVYELSDSVTVYLLDDKPLMAKINVRSPEISGEYIIPLLSVYYVTQHQLKYPHVVVDDGAVPHIINGADVMRPGIKEVVGEFDRGSVVVIRDMKGRPIGVGIALFSSQEMKEIQRGKVIRTIHHIGDKLWSMMRRN